MNKRRYPVPRQAVGMPVPSQSFESNAWMNAREAAVYLRTSVGAIRNLVYRGKLTPYKPFGRLLFKRSELARCVESSRQGGINGY